MIEVTVFMFTETIVVELQMQEPVEILFHLSLMLTIVELSQFQLKDWFHLDNNGALIITS